MEKQARAIAVIGGTGSGKTYYIKNEVLPHVHPKALLIYDINKEYSDVYPYPLLDMDEFLNIASRVTNSVIIIEDATSFFSNRGYNNKLVKLLVAKRHTNNTIFVLFHAMRKVPVYVYDLCNNVVIHRTADNVQHIDLKFKNDNLSYAIQDVKASKEPYPRRIIETY